MDTFRGLAFVLAVVIVGLPLLYVIARVFGLGVMKSIRQIQKED